MSVTAAGRRMFLRCAAVVSMHHGACDSRVAVQNLWPFPQSRISKIVPYLMDTTHETYEKCTYEICVGIAEVKTDMQEKIEG
jgi:hypothetical protein